MNDRLVLHAEGVSKRFDDNRVLHDVHLGIARGQIAALVGESGCGKSVLLNLILGTMGPSAGRLCVVRGAERVDIESPGPDRGIVYQGYQVYPFLTVLENVAYGPKLSYGLGRRIVGSLTGAWRAARRSHLEEAERLLVHMGLAESLGKYPHELSGGMRQRVAIASALMMKPEILLLDEPFGALDEATREQLQQLFLKLYWEDNMAAVARGEQPPYTVVIVTHELREALLVGDRVIGLSKYWNWKGEGHDRFPGATVVYDCMAPVERPGEILEASAYDAQIREIRDVVMAKNNGIRRDRNVRFWDQVRAGEAEGVLAPTRGT